MRRHLLTALLAGLINQFLVAACLGAQASDISGTWVFSITMETGARDSQETFALKQQGEKVAGLYLGPFGEKEITGSVTGNTVVIVVEVFRDNRTVKATYTGTIESPVKMAGAIEDIGDPGARGKWTAIKRDPNAKGKAGEVVIEPATLTTPETGTVHFELGTLYVPENRADPNSRIIGVGFARFRASQPTGAPPTFHLPGGPGDSFLTALKQSNRQLSALAKATSPTTAASATWCSWTSAAYSERGDVLKFNYRTPDEPLDQPASLARSTAAFADTGPRRRGGVCRRRASICAATPSRSAPTTSTTCGRRWATTGSPWSAAASGRSGASRSCAGIPTSWRGRCCRGGTARLRLRHAVARAGGGAADVVGGRERPAPQPYLPPGGLTAAAREVLRRLERAPVQVPVKDRTEDGRTGDDHPGAGRLPETFPMADQRAGLPALAVPRAVRPVGALRRSPNAGAGKPSPR